MSARWLASTVDESVARKKLDLLARGGRFSLKRLISPSECRVTLECCVFPFREVLVPGRSGRSAELLVNGLTRDVFRHSESVVRNDQGPDPLGAAYPLGDDETLEVVRQVLLTWKMNRLVDRTIDTESLRLGECLWYPFWVRLGEARSGKISLEMLDGITGRPCGVMVKQSYLKLLKANQSCR